MQCQVFTLKQAKKATQQLFLLMANKGWLGIYGTQGMKESDFSDFADYGLEFGKGSLKIPYDMPELEYKKLLQLIMSYNAKRNGFDISEPIKVLYMYRIILLIELLE